MENSIDSLSSSLFIAYDDIDSNDILTCRSCNNIPLFGIKYKNKNVYLEYICQNRHYECGKFVKQYKKIKNFILKPNHNNITKNLSTPYYCNTCLKHNQKIIGYCNTCFKNICEDYSFEHLKHKITFNEDFYVNKFQVDEIKNNIQNAKNFLSFLNNFYDDLIKKIHKFILLFKKSYLNYKKINEYQIKFSVDIIENYENLKYKDMINYEILYNLKNIIKFNNFKQNLNKNLNNNFLDKLINFYKFTTNFNNFILKDSNLFLIEINQKQTNSKKKKFPKKPKKKNTYDSHLILKLIQFLFPIFINNRKIFSTESPKEILQYFKYIGGKKFGKFNGFGMATIDGMGTYIGNFENNLIYGIGKIYQDIKFLKNNFFNLNSINYSNAFKNNNYYSNTNNQVLYKGEISNYERKGFGILYYGHFKYKGYFKNNFLNSYGILTNKKTHDKFIGTFKDEKKHGYFLLMNKFKKVVFYQQYQNNELVFSVAEFTNNQGTNIVGQTKSTNDLTLNGYAICKYKNNDEYEGFFSNGEKNGHGICKCSNGDKYYGNWKNNKRNGKGTEFKENGEIYEGNWKDDKKFGFGRIYLKEKKIFEGKFSNNLKEGEGIFFYSNGDTLKGFWKNDLIEGEALYYYKNNNKFVKKNYVKGKFINCNKI